MTKWEYMYIEIKRNRVRFVDGHVIGDEVGGRKSKGHRPRVIEFLNQSGQEGWEVAGLCQTGETATSWRIVLKRQIM